MLSGHVQNLNMNLEFRVTKKFVNELLDVLDELVKEIRRREREVPLC